VVATSVAAVSMKTESVVVELTEIPAGGNTGIFVTIDVTIGSVVVECKLITMKRRLTIFL
jgi:hypothetical protein